MNLDPTERLTFWRLTGPSPFHVCHSIFQITPSRHRQSSVCNQWFRHPYPATVVDEKRPSYQRLLGSCFRSPNLPFHSPLLRQSSSHSNPLPTDMLKFGKSFSKITRSARFRDAHVHRRKHSAVHSYVISESTLNVVAHREDLKRRAHFQPSSITHVRNTEARKATITFCNMVSHSSWRPSATKIALGLDFERASLGTGECYSPFGK